MTTLRYAAALVLVMAAALPARAADLAAEEQAIRDLDAAWVATVATKDPAATAAYYAEDGAIMPPGAPARFGREAIAAAWGDMFALKDFALTFAPTRIVIAESGDVAWEVGTYDLSFTVEAGPASDKGKYVVAWQKVDGVWKVGADIFNSDGPAP